MSEWKLHKYPRTAHLEGSRLGYGDDTETIPVKNLAGQQITIEEKIDGANTGISFDADGQMHIQSRGHPLTGGPRETQFTLLKTWAATQQKTLHEVLGDRHIAYGEWCYAKHSMFYDQLPHYWLEFDILDTKTGLYLDTATRTQMWAGTGVVSVPVIGSGTFTTINQITAHIQNASYQSAGWKTNLYIAAQAAGISDSDAANQTDMSGLCEGLYLKSEAGGQVIGRYKWVRSGFNQTISESGSHWSTRPIIVNTMARQENLWQ